MECDSRHLVFRKYLLKCGFLLEATLRKHKILNERNSDTCVYVILNSEWSEAQTKLKRVLGIPLTAKKEKVALMGLK